ncbi:MAG: heme exporter protein CcmD [Rhodobacterales bacterium]|nr:MAG: heme exporter protein CcmD [Rhodobacterales bacterium]
MTPDLGQYAGPVLWSYALTLGLIVMLVGVSLARSRKVRAQLEDVEARRTSDG